MKFNRILKHVSLAITLALFLGGLAWAQYEQPLDEVTLGLTQRRAILSSYPKVEDPRLNAFAQYVFGSLLLTPTGAAAPALSYEVTVIDHGSPNAFVTAGGKIYVTRSLAEILGNDTGAWAGVIGHELGHAIGRHLYMKYLRAFEFQRQVAYYRAQAAAGDESANWALLGIAIAGPLVNLKLSRDEEHEADRIGLMMMAQAGYHPDFAVTFQRRIRRLLGDQSKIAAFFSDHPRWETREQRTMRAYEEALRLYQSRWPEPNESLGGSPPIIVVLGKPSTSQDKAERAALISVPISIRNAKDKRVLLVALFSKNGKVVTAALPGFRLKDGGLFAAEVLFPSSSEDSRSVTLKVPTAALSGKDRKLKASIVAFGDDEVLDELRPITVSFPKPK